MAHASATVEASEPEAVLPPGGQEPAEVDKGVLAQLQGIEEAIRIDSADRGTRFLLISKGGNHLKVGAAAYTIVQRVHAGSSFASLAREFTENGASEVTEAEIESAYNDVTRRISEITRREISSYGKGFWFQWQLIPPAIVSRVASRLAIAFRASSALVLLAFIAVTGGLMVAQGMPQSPASTAALSGYLLFILSLLAHEFGHASACSHFGAAPSGIGFTFYLIYPAFYSDVTAAWRLGRWQRVAVDAGGTYFQLIAGGGFSVVYFFSGWEPLRIAYFLMLYGMIFSLNPIFRFDGYWIASDALGVTNLAAQPRIFARYVMQRLRGETADPLPWPSWLVAVLVTYAVVSVSVWTFLISRLIPYLLYQSLAFPRMLAVAWETFRNGGLSRELGQQLSAILVSTLLLVIFYRLLWGLIARPAWAMALKLSSRWREKTRESEPPLESGQPEDAEPARGDLR
jgi:putative peptide zinc metalloprotease protein